MVIDMKVAVEILAMYGVYVFGASVLIWRYATTNDRGPSVVVAWLMPVLIFAAVLEGTFRLLFGKSPRIRKCPAGLAEAEMVVEKRRQKMFGGEQLATNFASDWARLYGVTLEEEAKKVQKFARRVLSPA
jgi:hypothetical protein